MADAREADDCGEVAGRPKPNNRVRRPGNMNPTTVRRLRRSARRESRRHRQHPKTVHRAQPCRCPLASPSARTSDDSRSQTSLLRRDAFRCSLGHTCASVACRATAPSSSLRDGVGFMRRGKPEECCISSTSAWVVRERLGFSWCTATRRASVFSVHAARTLALTTHSPVDRRVPPYGHRGGSPCRY